MINKILFLALLFTMFGSCNNLFLKKNDVYIDSKQYGWYILYLEQDSNELFEDKKIFLDEKDKRYARLKVKKFNEYKINVYDINSKNLVSEQMKLASYSGDLVSVIEFSFYNPNPKLYHDTVFNPGSNEEKSKINSHLRRIKDSISNLND